MEGDKLITLYVEAGENIEKTCGRAATIAAAQGSPVAFSFNETPGHCQPGETWETCAQRWWDDRAKIQAAIEQAKGRI